MKRLPSRGVTIREVATHAGVSVATVSRALAGTRNVSPDIARRVRAAARDLHYQRNALASALRSQTTGVVGMVVPRISNPFFPLIIEAVERRLQREGYNLLLCDSQDDPAVEPVRAAALLEQRVDGLIISPCDATRSITLIRQLRTRLPVVQLDRSVQGNLTSWVGLDDDAGIASIVEHLRLTDARSFAFISSTPDNSSGRLRLAAYRNAVGGVHRPSVKRLYLGDFTSDWGRAAARQIIAGDKVPDAVVCGNDLVALGVLQAFQEASLKVPDDVAVTGYDDIGFATLCSPQLTTMRQPYEEMAEQCIHLLTRQAPSAPAQNIAIAPTLVVRSSTRPLNDPLCSPRPTGSMTGIGF